MLISKINFCHFGPFAFESELSLEPEVTVLTGANDTGKSSLLALIEKICSVTGSGNAITESDVNLDRIGESKTSWDQDRQIGGQLLFKGTEFSTPHVGGQWGDGDELKVDFFLAPKVRSFQLKGFRSKGSTRGWSVGGNVQIKSFPNSLLVPSKEPLRSVIDLSAPNSTELSFLQTAFGSNFSFANYRSLSDAAFASFLSKARGDVSQKLRDILPPSMAYDFDFQNVGGQRDQLSIQLRDSHTGHTPLGIRGTGMQRLVSLMGSLLCNPMTSGHFIVLLDEPETSLHSDTQHSFRRIIESIASRPNIQVVYTTHSPSMINTSRPDSIRVLSREQKDGKAHSTIVHRSFDGSYFAVRSSLGVTPADSLLYGPIMLIVEGPTEVRGVPIAIRKLADAGINGFEDASLLLSQIHIVDGEGDSFEYICRIAKSQGSKPIIFLDGDKDRRMKAVREKHDDVPILTLEERREFEEIVPHPVYLSAVRHVIAENAGTELADLTYENYRTWVDSANLPQQMVFTKRVERWLQDKFDGLALRDKPLIMKNALETVDPAELSVDKLRELVGEVRNLLKAL